MSVCSCNTNKCWFTGAVNRCKLKKDQLINLLVQWEKYVDPFWQWCNQRATGEFAWGSTPLDGLKWYVPLDRVSVVCEQFGLEWALHYLLGDFTVPW